MDSRHFDSLARALSAGDTRRGAARSLAASSLALGLARIGLGEADARKKRKKKGKKKLLQICKKGKECKGNLGCQLTEPDEDQCGTTFLAKRCCIPQGQSCNYSCECCGEGATCNGGICQ